MNEVEIRRRAEAWCATDPDPQMVEELKGHLERGDYAELAERFAGSLQFGTAGLRGLLGAGPNRMNRAVVRRATAGLARYLKTQVPEVTARGIVLGRDARLMSREFAEDAARVLVGEGVPVLYFEDPVPTPLVAFATPHLNASGGVMITASHNPPAFNGYKVYWENGAQIIPPHDQEISAAIERVEGANRVPFLSVEDARRRGLWRSIPHQVGTAYLDGIAGLRAHPEISTELTIVYTALHGVGGRWFEAAMAAAKIGPLHPVPEQHSPDPRFPTVPFPNPEEPGALDLSRALAEKLKADLVLANDPDADRLAVMARGGDQKLSLLTGNEVGVLLGHYLLTQSKRAGGKPLVISTIVSSSQLREIARQLGALYDETLTGFKWIANRALQREKEGAELVFAYEEALGYTVGTLVRDKDGIGAAVAFADLACWCRSRSWSVLDYLEQIQRQYGLFVAEQRSFTLAGAEGHSRIRLIMEAFRHDPPSRIADWSVITIRDYLSGEARSAGRRWNIDLPSADVLAYELEGGARVMLRPSGTEPKIKYYFEVQEALQQDEPVSFARRRAAERVRQLEEAFIRLAGERGQP